MTKKTKRIICLIAFFVIDIVTIFNWRFFFSFGAFGIAIVFFLGVLAFVLLLYSFNDDKKTTTVQKRQIPPDYVINVEDTKKFIYDKMMNILFQRSLMMNIDRISVSAVKAWEEIDEPLLRQAYENGWNAEMLAYLTIRSAIMCESNPYYEEKSQKEKEDMYNFYSSCNAALSMLGAITPKFADEENKKYKTLIQYK